MALADTAELAVRLTLDDRFSRGIGNVERRLGSLERGVAKVGRGVSTTSRVMGTFGGIVLDRVVSAGVRTLTSAFQAGTASLAELEAVGLRTTAVIKSTGGAAGVTAGQVREYAESLEDLTTFDDKAIQNAENLLLTFTNVNKRAFKPALEAVLDLNAAMGGGDEGLQGVAIQVGKALNDPVRGLTALRRVGVSFTTAQQKQIKRLVEQNKLYEAQAIILGELNKEFGGQAEAFGQGAAADARRFADAVEGVQQALARGLAPAVQRVRRGLTEAFKDPAVLSAIERLGTNIANLFSAGNIQKGVGLFTKAMDALGKVDFQKALAGVDFKAIGDGLRITGQAAKVAVDAFMSLPPDLQKIAIAALAVNKLTGGLVTSGIGALANLALSSLKTITAANVTVIGANVTGAGGVGGAAGKGRLGNLLKLGLGITGVGLVAGLAEEFGDEIQGVGKDIGNGWRDFLEKEVGLKLPTINPSQVEWPFGPKNTPTILPEIFGGNGLLGGTAAGVGSNRGTLDKNSDRMLDAHDRSNDLLTRIVQNTKRPPKAVQQFRQAEKRVGTSTTFRTIAQAEGGDKTIIPVVQSLTRALVQGNSPWARDLSVMKGHLGNLQALEQRFLAVGDTKNAALIRSAIASLQGAITTRQERETNATRLAKQAVEGTGDAVDRTRGAVATMQAATTTKLSAVNNILGLVRTATAGILPGLSPKVTSVGGRVDALGNTIRRNPPKVGVTVTTNTKVNVSARDVSIQQSRSSHYGYSGVFGPGHGA